MKRRHFLLSLASIVFLPISAAAQRPERTARIGVLWHAANEQEEAAFLAPLRRGLADAGLIEGKNLTLENRYPAERPELFAKFANELATLNVDVLVAISIPAALAARRATSSIPIVFCPIPDPVGLGLVATLARPGGNMTGVSSMAFDLAAKRIQLFKEGCPALTKLALLLNPNSPYDVRRAMDESEPAAKQLGMSIIPIEARAADDLENAFESIVQKGLEGIIVSQNALYFNERHKVAELAIRHRLPTMMPADLFVAAGGLMAYGPDWPALFRKVGPYVEKILRGAKPADLPVEQPTEFQLVLNLKTARALNLNIPPHFKSRADTLIE